VLDHKAEKLDAELQKFMAHAMGNQAMPTRRFASSVARRRAK
jgi:hypothetical protein